MSTIRVNVQYQTIPSRKWQDSPKRADHVIDRMQLRGIGIDNIKDAVMYGAKTLREDGCILTEYRWYKVVYREFQTAAFKKIYPITILLINHD